MKCFVDENTLNVCPRRRVLDVTPFRQFLLDSGHELSDDPAQADKVYLFTCAFNKPQEERSMAAIKDCRIRHGNKLVVAGCLPTIDISKVGRHFAGDVVTNVALRDLPGQLIGGKDIGVCRGCVGSCSYCVDKIAVGPLRSRPLEGCIDDLKAGLRNGYRSFRIVGDDLGAWGQDIGSDFIVLLEALATLDTKEPVPAYCLHVLELNVNWLIRYRGRFQVFGAPQIGDVLVGIQSASDRVLGLMNRNYSPGKAHDALAALKQLGKRVGVHFIVGFPTETWQEFQESLEFILSAGIDFGFIFAHSDMEGTPAYHIYPKVANVESRMAAARAFLQKRGYHVVRDGAAKLKFVLRKHRGG